MTSHIQQHMHDIKPDTDQGNGNVEGTGDEFYVLGERCETDNNDTYENYGTILYGNSKISKYEDLQLLHGNSFQENFANNSQTSFLGQNQEVGIQGQDGTTFYEPKQDLITSQERSNVEAHGVVHALARSSNDGGATDFSSAPADAIVTCDTHSLPLMMSHSPQQHTFYENLQAWENGTFFKSTSRNF